MFPIFNYMYIRLMKIIQKKLQYAKMSFES